MRGKKEEKMAQIVGESKIHPIFKATLRIGGDLNLRSKLLDMMSIGLLLARI